MFGALCRDDAYPSTFTFNIGKAADDLQHPDRCMAKNLGESMGLGRKFGFETHGESCGQIMGESWQYSIRVSFFVKLDLHLVSDEQKMAIFPTK